MAIPLNGTIAINAFSCVSGAITVELASTHDYILGDSIEAVIPGYSQYSGLGSVTNVASNQIFTYTLNEGSPPDQTETPVGSGTVVKVGYNIRTGTILRWNEFTETWVPLTPSAADQYIKYDGSSLVYSLLSFDDLFDVNVSGASENDILKFTGGSWVATQLNESIVLNDISDVDLTIVPTDGQVLIYNEDLDLWVAGDNPASNLPTVQERTSKTDSPTNVLLTRDTFSFDSSAGFIVSSNGTGEAFISFSSSVELATIKGVDVSTTAPVAGTSWCMTTSPETFSQSSQEPLQRLFKVLQVRQGR